MPFYHVNHIIPLTVPQKDALAEAITKLHTTRFTTPRLFVNVEFTDTSLSATYVGGKRCSGNRIYAHVRTGPSRTQEEWDELCKDIDSAWHDIIVRNPMPRAKGQPELDTRLKSVILLGGLTAGIEQGILLPPAGGDVAWLKENWPEFERRAANGDEDMKDLVQEVRERGLLDGSGEKNQLKNAAKTLEDMLGWGDAA